MALHFTREEFADRRRRTRAEIVRALRQLAAKRAALPPKKHGNIPL